jgi:hypothetical protein
MNYEEKVKLTKKELGRLSDNEKKERSGPKKKG